MADEKTGLRPATWQDVIRHEAKQAKVPAELALAIADTESGFDPAAVSKKGARGFFQLMPDTAKELGVDPDDPIQNIRGGLKYFRQQLDAYGGSVEKALQAYNWGPGNVARGGEMPAETQAYVQKILGRLGQSPTPAATAAPIEKLPVQSVTQMNRAVGTPPPGGPPTRERSREAIVGEPPPTMLGSMAEGLDPRTRTGRRGFLGTVGGVVGGVIGNVPGAVVGAGAGGALAETIERVVPPPSAPGSESVMASQPSILGAAGEQAAYEVLGHAFAFPVKAIGKRVLASPVVRQASQHFDELLRGAKDALSQTRLAVSGAVESAVEAGSALKESASERAAKLVQGTRVAGRESVQKATESGQAAVGAAEAPWAAVGSAPPVTPSVAGRRATEVIRGPARSAREEIGQAVEAAADAGPDVDIRALKDEAHRIIGEELQPPAQAFPAPGRQQALSPAEQTIQELQPLMANFTPERVAALTGPQKAQYEAMQAAMTKAQDEYKQEILKHPAMQVLGRILSADDTVPFKAAHLFKRELDDAIGTAWDRSVRSRVTNITKVMRGNLRSALSGFAPYDQATKAYQQIAPLFNKGIAPKLLKLAEESPESVVRLIKGNDPTSARMLRDLMVDLPGQVGEGKQGQYAWDSVRAAWTHEKLIKGGVAGFEDRLAKLDPEFVETMYGDGPGRMVLDNLKTISAAVKQAAEQAGVGVTAAKRSARAAGEAAQTQARGIRSEASKVARAQVRDVRRQGRQVVQQGLTDVARAGAEGRKLALSSLVQATRNDALVDVLRAGAQGPGSLFGGISTMRLLRGVKDDELIKYAAYSSEATQALVGLLTGPAPAAAAGSLLRLLGGVLGVDEITASGVGTPPPEAPQPEPTASPLAGLVGAPPP